MSYKKYFVYKKQVSGDGGITWQDTVPLETTPSGESIASYSTMNECEGNGFKLYVTYLDGTHYTIPCSSSSETLTRQDTREPRAPQSHQNITDVVIGECVTTIGEEALGNFVVADGFLNLSGVTLPNNLTTIDDEGFLASEAIKKITIPDSVTTIGHASFAGCVGLTELTIGSGITSISDNAFQQIGVEHLTVPDNVTIIGFDGFYQNESCKTITLGRGISTIGDYAFYYYPILESITIHAVNPPFLSTHAFDETNNAPIYVPAASVNAYKSAWSQLASRIQAIPT